MSDLARRELARLHDPVALARRVPGRAHLASSYDRRGGNHDWSNYVRAEGRAAVLLDVEGPGLVTRIWTADPQKGTVRVYVDRMDQPAIECPLAGLFGMLPLTQGIGGESPGNYARAAAERVPMGHTAYCPIPFARRCRIVVDPEDDYLYYQVNYRTMPVDGGVPEGEWDALLGDPSVVAAAKARADPVAAGIDGVPGSVRVIDLAPGQEEVLLDHVGAGMVREVTIQLPTGADDREAEHLRDNVWLVAHFDDDEPRDPSVRAPIGPLFLHFGQERPGQSILVGVDGDGTGYCRFAMPHHERARLVLRNRGVLATGPMRVSVRHQPMEVIDEDLLRFRATWHQETPFGPDHRDYGGPPVRILNQDGRDNYEFLNVRAAGHFVGCGFHADLRDAPTDRAAGEGDEMFFIDDDPALTHYGTGAEDYVNDAWGIRGYNGPVSGDGIRGEWFKDPQLYGYRLHLLDAVPFLWKARFTLEHGTGNNCSGHYRSVAYWYMEPSSARTRVEERQWEEIRNHGTRGAGS